MKVSKLFTVVIILSALLAFSALCFLIILSLIKINEGNKVNDKKSHDSWFQQLEKEFGHFDNQIQMSQSDKGAYSCSGTCSCVEDETRKSVGVLIQRSFTFLISAVTSIVAYNKAREYFKEKCSEELSGSCPKSSIKAELGRCEMVWDCTEEHFSEEDKPEDTWYDQDVDNKKTRLYNCVGVCSQETSFKREDKMKQARDYKCYKMESREQIKVTCKGLNDEECLLKAREMYKKYFMDVYCKNYSQVNLKLKEENEEYDGDKFSACRGDLEKIQCAFVYLHQNVQVNI